MRAEPDVKIDLHWQDDKDKRVDKDLSLRIQGIQPLTELCATVSTL